MDSRAALPPSGLRSPPAPPPPCSLRAPVSTARFGFWRSRSVGLSFHGPAPASASRPLASPAPRGSSKEQRPVRAPRSKALPELTFHPGLGAGVVGGPPPFRGFVLFLFSVSFLFIIYERVFCFQYLPCCFFVDLILAGLALESRIFWVYFVFSLVCFDFV